MKCMDSWTLAAFKKIAANNCVQEYNKLCIPFKEPLAEAQLTTFHKLLDIVSETAAAEMRAAYKAGFKGSVALMREVQE